MSFVLVIVAFVSMVVISAILLWRFWPRLAGNMVDTGGGGGSLSVASFNQPCSTTIPCQQGLVCAGNFCKKELGQECNSLNDCAQTGPQKATNCDGVCSIGPVGNLRQACPCNSNLVCVTNVEGNDWCLGGPNYECSSNSDCVSGICIISQPGSTGRCSNLRPNGAPCDINSECGSDFCSPGCMGCQGFCQPSGPTGTFETGKSGAVCFAGAPAPSVGVNVPGCDSGLACQNGVCTQTAIGLNAFCKAEVPCVPPQICCFNNCRYPLDPNTATNKTCSDTYTNINGDCLGDCGTSTTPAQPCTSNEQCESGICASINGTIKQSNGTVGYWNGNGSWEEIIKGTPINSEPFQKLAWYDPSITPGSTGSFVNTGWLNRPYSLWGSASDGLYHYDGTQWTQTLLGSLTDDNGAVGNIIPSALAIDSNNTPYLGYNFSTTTQGPTGTNVSEIWDAIYQINISNNGAGDPIPFNTTTGQLGEQIDENGLGIKIYNIDISRKNDYIIGDSDNVSGLIYIKRSDENTYTVGQTGFNPKFYTPVPTGINNPGGIGNIGSESYDSYSYVTDKVLIQTPQCLSNPTPDCFDTCGQVIVFNGQLRGQIYLQPYATPIFGQTGSIDPNTPSACVPSTTSPSASSTVCDFYQRTYDIIDYSIYSDGPNYVINGPIWIIARISQGATWSQYIILTVINGIQRQVNGYAGSQSRIVSTASSADIDDPSFFGKQSCLMYSPGICSC